jgi:hypothetical protein
MCTKICYLLEGILLGIFKKLFYLSSTAFIKPRVRYPSFNPDARRSIIDESDITTI